MTGKATHTRRFVGFFILFLLGVNILAGGIVALQLLSPRFPFC